VQRISDAELQTNSQRDSASMGDRNIASTPARELKDSTVFSVRCAQNFAQPSIRTQSWTLLPM